MSVYLVEHPPRIQQFRCPRREQVSGIIGVHTAESIADEIGPDTGAENVAAFIARRTNYGSYHWLADSDSRIQLVEHGCVAYHIGTHGFNEHTIGISAAVQASRWDEVGDDWEDACLRNLARCAFDAALYIERRTGIIVPARRLTLSEALARRPGFLAHGTADPERRTDPDGPNHEFDWTRFFRYYSQLQAQRKDWLDMATKQEVKEAFIEALDEFTKRPIFPVGGDPAENFRQVIGRQRKDINRIHNMLAEKLQEGS
jgi:hypothetical protein